jgi:peptidoglycan/LPS O-acetylase OafA/YrhL
MENRYMPALNGLRGFAFLNVLIEHNFVYIKSIGIAQPAVTLFFVLSGYLLSSQLYSKLMKTGKMSIVNYTIRRFFRIYPCYLLTLLLDYCTGRIDSDKFILLIFLSDNFKQFWTIFYETRAYIVIPILVYIIYCLRNTAFKLIFIGISVVAFSLWFASFTFTTESKNIISITSFLTSNLDYFTKNIGLLYFLPMFCLGVFAGVINYHRTISKIQLNNSYVGLISLILAMSHILYLGFSGVHLLIYSKKISFQFDRDNLNFYFSIGYSIVVILLSAEGSNFFKKVMESKLFLFLGDISYPGYLFHLSLNYVIIKIFSVNPVNNILVFTCITVPLIIIFSYLVHITVENYFIRKTKNMCINSLVVSERKVYVTLPHSMRADVTNVSIPVDPMPSI